MASVVGLRFRLAGMVGKVVAAVGIALPIFPAVWADSSDYLKTFGLFPAVILGSGFLDLSVFLKERKASSWVEAALVIVVLASSTFMLRALPGLLADAY